MKSLSVVIPAYNEELLIGHCIECIHTQLEFWNIDYEVVVVDNNCTDNTVNIARQLNCRVAQCQPKGITHARQAGFVASEGEIVAFIDADTCVPAGWFLRAYVGLLDEDTVAVSGPYRYYGLVWYKALVVYLFYRLGKLFSYHWPMMQGGNFILKREALQQIGGFDTNISFYGEDTNTAMRLSKVGKVKFEFALFAYSSPRRMQVEGLFRTGMRYCGNYVWMHLTGRPYTTSYNDIRTT